MTKRLFLMGVLFAVLAAMTIGTAACGSSPTATSGTPTTTPPGTEAAIRAYADPATRTTLEGLSENSLAKYTQYGDAQFKAAVTQAIFDQLSAAMTAQYGTFESIAFLATEEVQGYTVVHYKATYSKGQIGVRMAFNTDHLVAGQFFE